MPDSNNVMGIKSFKNGWLVSGTPVNVIPNVPRVYAEIFNEGGVTFRLGPSGMASASFGLLLPSGTYVADSFSSDDWWAFSTAGGSGAFSAFWVEGL